MFVGQSQPTKSLLTIVSALSLVLLTAACSKKGSPEPAKVTTPAQSSAAAGVAGKTPNAGDRNFLSVQYMDSEPSKENSAVHMLLDQSDYTTVGAKNGFLCSVGNDDKSVLIEMRRSGKGAEDLRLYLTEVQMAADAQEVSSVGDLKLDGYSKNNWFAFDSKKQKSQTSGCSAHIEKKGERISGFFQCSDVDAINVADSRSAAILAKFSCPLVQMPSAQPTLTGVGVQRVPLFEAMAADRNSINGGGLQRTGLQNQTLQGLSTGNGNGRIRVIEGQRY